MKRLFSFSILLLISNLALGVDPMVSKSKPFKQEFSPKSPIGIRLKNIAGQNHIYSLPGNKVTVIAKTESGVPIPIVCDLSGNELLIEVKYPKGVVGGDSAQVVVDGNNITISGSGSTVTVNGKVYEGGKNATPPVYILVGIPNDLFDNLNAKSVSGDLSVKGPFPDTTKLGRTANLTTVSGEISILNLAAKEEFKLRNTSGAIKLTKADGELDIETVSGGVSSREGSGNIYADTISGDVQISNRTADLVEARTTSGDITLHNPNTKKERTKTVSGKVTPTK